MDYKGRWYQGEKKMIELEYSLVIEATEDPKFFGWYSPDIPGFTGTGKSIDDCIKRAREAIPEFFEVMRTIGTEPPKANRNPKVVIQNSRPFRSRKSQRLAIPKAV